jgi:hypothetical protein
MTFEAKYRLLSDDGGSPVGRTAKKAGPSSYRTPCKFSLHKDTARCVLRIQHVVLANPGRQLE